MSSSDTKPDFMEPKANRPKNATRPMSLAQLLSKTVNLFKCDSARIVEFDHTDRKFLVIGFKRKSEGDWERHDSTGVYPMTFEYTEESTIAVGKTWDSLWKSAKWFKSLEGMSVGDYLKRIASQSTQGKAQEQAKKLMAIKKSTPRHRPWTKLPDIASESTEGKAPAAQDSPK